MLAPIRPAALAATLLSGVVISLVACGDDPAQPPRSDAGATVGPEPQTIRLCKSAVYGELSQRYRRGAVTIGPLMLGGELGANAGGRFAGEKVVKVLANLRADETVTLAVPEGERRRLSLLYDDSGRGPRRPLRFSDGTSSARLSACPDADSQFNGGAVVRGAHCAPIQVWIEGLEQPLRGWLPFGTLHRPCPPSGG
jgi:hypothetical protein